MFDTGVETMAEAETGRLSWSGIAPDGLAVMLLDQAGPPADPFEELEQIGAWEKVVAWAQAQQYTRVARFVATAEAAPAAGMSAAQAVESAQAEVGLMLRLSPGAAAWRVGEARQLVEEFPAAFAALHAGAITLVKARIIAEGCADLDVAGAAVVEQKVLPRAPGQTNGRLRAAVRRAVLRVDGEAALRRRERKRRERGVVLYPERDGMATLSATLPAAEAVGTFAVLDQHARGCGSADERPMAARRADALVDLVLRETGFCSSAGQQVAAQAAAAAGSPGPQSDAGSSATAATTKTAAPTGVVPGAAAPTRAVRNSTAVASTGGAVTGGASTGGAKPTTAATATVAPRPSATAAAASAAVAGSAESERSDPGPAGAGSAAAHSAARTPTGASTDIPPTGNPAANVSATGSDTSGPGAERLPGIAPEGGVPAVTNRVSVQIRVTVPLDTLRGVSNEPGELAGYGPTPAEQARELAADPESVWRRLVTGPFSGALLDYGTTRYRPPPHLAEHVIACHQYCQHPGCRVPAHLCDLDHNEPYDPATDQGPTSAANLGPKCRAHHRLKGYPGWSVTQYVDGSIVWTTPSGHTYRVDPPPLTEPRVTRAADDEPPPF
jgi:hypothetical protein